MNTTRLFALPAFMLLIASDSVMATADTDNEGNVGIVLMIIAFIVWVYIMHWWEGRTCPMCQKERTFRATGKEKHEAEYCCSACNHTDWVEIKRKCQCKD